MGSQTRKITLDTAALVFGRAVGFVLGLVRLNYLARFLGLANFGVLNFATYFTSVFASLFDLGLSQLLTREIARNLSRSRELLGRVLVLKLGIAALASLFVMAVALLSGLRGEDLTAVLLTTVALAVNQVGLAFLSALQAHRKMALVSAASIINDAILSAAIILVLPGSPHVATALSITAMIAVLNLALLFLAYRKFVGTPILRTDRAATRMLLREGAPLAVSALGIALYTYAGPAILNYARGASELGLFSAGYKLIMILTIIPTAFTQVVYPVFSEFFARAREKLEKALADSLRVISLVSMPLAAGALVIGGDIFRLIYTDTSGAYLPGLAVFQLILLSSVFGYMDWILYSFLISVDRQRFVMWLSLLAGIATMAAGIIAIPLYGFMAIPFMVMGVEFLLFLLQILYVRRLGYRRLFLRQLAKPALAAAVMALGLALLSPPNLLVSVPLGAAGYGVLLLLLGALGDQERQILRAVSARLFPRREAP
jgi:O-antigen/teichoic acid export membrane protein